jgi:hypothetical protein
MRDQIPEDWRSAVCQILQAMHRNSITWTSSAQQRWEAESFGAHRADACQAMLVALSQPGITGKRHDYPNEPGETWAFLFTYQSVPFYGKVCLKNSRLIVKILSAHKPNPSDRNT